VRRGRGAGGLLARSPGALGAPVGCGFERASHGAVLSRPTHSASQRVARPPAPPPRAPGVLDCGPVLPAFPGQRPAEGAITLTNPTDKPVEVVCPDLDERARAEEEALRALDM
jgi:hypothetical protein